MRDTHLFATAFTAGLAAVLGLGPDAAPELRSHPADYEARPAGGQTLPTWLIRYKLRQQGYQDISQVHPGTDGFTLLARDRFGRLVKLFVDPYSGEIVPRAGYGLAHLRADEVPGHLDALGYRFLAAIAGGEAHYRVAALDETGARHLFNIDPLTGAMWRLEA